MYCYEELRNNGMEGVRRFEGAGGEVVAFALSDDTVTFGQSPREERYRRGGGGRCKQLTALGQRFAELEV